MARSRLALLCAASAAILLGGLGAASAQDATTRVIRVPQGAVVVVLQPGAMPVMPAPFAPFDTAFAFPAMPDPAAMVRQMDQMMAAAQRGVLPAGAGMRSVVVTSYSDGRGSCTRRVTYGGDGAAPKIEVSATGDASCGPAGMVPGASRPAASPEFLAPQPAAPRTIRVENSVAPQPPSRLVVAQLGD